MAAQLWCWECGTQWYSSAYYRSDVHWCPHCGGKLQADRRSGGERRQEADQAVMAAKPRSGRDRRVLRPVPRG